jgi:transcriptional regulator with XRE-family HTH domain
VISRGRGGLVTVDRPGFDGERQREALQALQKAAGLEATAVAQAVGLSYPQYNRYLWGRVPLRTDQISAFAAAYKVSRAELTRALGLLDDEPVSALDASIREALAGAKAAGGQRGLDQIADSLAPLSDEDREHVLRTVSEAIGTFRPDLIE